MNVLSGQSVPPFSLIRNKVPSRYRWLPHISDARSAGGRPALLILLVIMLAGVSGCATIEDAALRTPEMGESIDEGSLPRELDPDLSIPNHSASLPMSGPAQSTSDGNDLSASFVPWSDFEGKSSGLIVRTLARLRGGSIIPMPDKVSIRAPEIWSLRPPVVKVLGDDLAPLRPPLRQSWLYHRTVPPAGYEMELRLPDSAFLALGERVSSGPFRNTSAGFRDQPLLHPEPASLPAESSKLPEIGPPPPHHTVETFVLAWQRVSSASVSCLPPVHSLEQPKMDMNMRKPGTNSKTHGPSHLSWTRIPGLSITWGIPISARNSISLSATTERVPCTLSSSPLSCRRHSNIASKAGRNTPASTISSSRRSWAQFLEK